MVKECLEKVPIKSEVLNEAKGTEESFLSLDSKAPQILHVSTHGFYLDPEKAKKYAFTEGYTDAMNLSGIILSGGNAGWTRKSLPEGVRDGVLTANEIANLNLSGIDLLFLNTCQSGQGKITSEGVYGLLRAFKKAGVGTIIMSLWSVEDPVAMEFAVKYYEALTDPRNNMDKRAAFEAAQKHIRDWIPKQEGFSDNPYYWAVFSIID